MKMMLYTSVAVLAAAHAAVDVRPPMSTQVASSPVVSPLDKPLKVHLERVKARGSSAATFYIGKLAIGQPQRS